MEESNVRSISSKSKVELLRLPADDGYPLGVRVFEPAGRARAVAHLHPATAVPASYYDSFGEYLADRGIRFVTYDYRGIGDSRPVTLRGFPATMSDWAFHDARSMMRWARETAPGLPDLHIGHSFGGQIVGLLDEARHASAAIFVTSQLGYYGHWDGLAKWRLLGLWKGLVPFFNATLGYFPGKVGMGEDLPGGVASEWAKWCTHPGYLMGSFSDARERFSRFDVPTQLWSFSDDDYAPERAVAHLSSVLPAHRVKREAIRPRDVDAAHIGHFAFFRPKFEPTLWRRALSFAEPHLNVELRRAE
jgi:predicted alpha/beta hydrolase